MADEADYEARAYPTHVTLLWQAEDGLTPVRLMEIIEHVRSMAYLLPGTIVDISMNDHHLRIELR